METARMIREDFLQQDAFGDVDAYSSLDRQFGLLGLILSFDGLSRDAMQKGVGINSLLDIPARGRIARAKNVPAEVYAEEYAKISSALAEEIEALSSRR
jgi:V/A-type H+-transporting ATPase subunit A